MAGLVQEDQGSTRHVYKPPGGLGRGALGPAALALLLPDQDNLRTGRLGGDRNGLALQATQTALLNVVHLTHRETRWLLLGGRPTPGPQIPYPGIPFMAKYLNHCLLPSLIDPRNYKSYFALDSQNFYQFRDQFVVPVMIVHNSKQVRCVNHIEEVCKDIEKTITPTI